MYAGEIQHQKHDTLLPSNEQFCLGNKRLNFLGSTPSMLTFPSLVDVFRVVIVAFVVNIFCLSPHIRKCR